MDGVAALASALTEGPAIRVRQAEVTAVSGTGLTLKIGGAQAVSGIRYLSSTSPVVGSSVWLVTDGRDAFAFGAIESGWTTYTPTVTAGSGTITAATATGKYRRLGSMVTVTASVTITTVGTGAGALLVTLPLSASATAPGSVGAGRDVVTSNLGLTAYVAPSATTASVLLTTGATCIVANYVNVFTVTYEAA